ncbi:MAG: inositol monophosphatase family protein, partial [Planctomycetia bacterium]
EVVVGVVLEPAIGRLTYASRGAGCFVQTSPSAAPARCTVRPTERMADAVLSMSRSQGAAGEAKLLAGFGAASAVQTYSAGIKLAQVARGETDVYLGDYISLRDWDISAGCILVTEAGGTITDIDGNPVRYGVDGVTKQKRGVLASNGPLHAAALAALAEGRVHV